MTITGAPIVSDPAAARTALDAHVREIVSWHFDPATGSPFWLDYARKLGWDPRREISGFSDLGKLGAFEDEWLRGGPVQRWIPKGLAGKPVFVFETGGTTGTPKTRIACDDFEICVSPLTTEPSSNSATSLTSLIVAGKMCPLLARISEESLIASVKSPVTSVIAARKRLPKL